MDSLRTADWLQLQEFVLDLHAAPALAGLPARALAGIRRLIPYDSASLQDDRGGVRRIPWLYENQPWQPDTRACHLDAELGVRMMTVYDPPFHRLRDVFFAVSADRHPHTDYFRRTGDGSARRMSEIMTVRELHGTRFYNELARRNGLHWQLTIYLPMPPAHTLTLALLRQAFDFSARDRALLEQARPHLAVAWRRAWERHREERRWRRLAGSVAGAAPVWPNPSPQDDAAGARALRRLGLSLREADVLYWVAQGKTNAETGTILGLKPTTAKHYVERLLAKLGCENRTAAARTALETLGG